MAIFVLILVGVVVAQTWVDWSDTRKKWIVPDWAKGTALAGVIAVSLAAIASFASVWIQDSASQTGPEVMSKLFWPELAFLVCMMAVIVVSAVGLAVLSNVNELWAGLLRLAEEPPQEK